MSNTESMRWPNSRIVRCTVYNAGAVMDALDSGAAAYVSGLVADGVAFKSLRGLLAAFTGDSAHSLTESKGREILAQNGYAVVRPTGKEHPIYTWALRVR